MNGLDRWLAVLFTRRVSVSVPGAVSTSKLRLVSSDGSTGPCLLGDPWYSTTLSLRIVPATDSQAEG